MSSLSQVSAGQTILASHHNEIYSLLKGVLGSGEAITLIYNAAGGILFQPSSDPAAGTEAIQVKNNVGTVQGSLTYDGKVKAADGTVSAPGLRFQSEATGLYLISAGLLGLSVAGVQRFILGGATGDTVADLGSNRDFIFKNATVEFARFIGSSGALQIGTGTSGKLQIGTATTKQLVSRFLNNAALTVTNAVSGTYVDFGGSFTTGVTTVAGDQVVLRVQGIAQKAVGTYGAIVVDRSGTKLPAAGGGSSVLIYFNTVATPIPFMLEVVDTPGAGTFTYKPQVYTADNNTASAGLGSNCQYVVEVWR